MSEPAPTGAPSTGEGAEDALAVVMADLDAVLAGLESTAATFGRTAALPFLGLARYEVSEATHHGRLPVRPPDSFESGELHIEELVAQGLALEPCLSDSLRLLRTQGLMREAQAWMSRGHCE